MSDTHPTPDWHALAVELHARATQAQTMLRRYGRHAHLCRATTYLVPERSACDCRLAEALAPLPPLPPLPQATTAEPASWCDWCHKPMTQHIDKRGHPVWICRPCRRQHAEYRSALHSAGVACRKGDAAAALEIIRATGIYGRVGLAAGTGTPAPATSDHLSRVLVELADPTCGSVTEAMRRVDAGAPGEGRQQPDDDETCENCGSDLMDGGICRQCGSSFRVGGHKPGTPEARAAKRAKVHGRLLSPEEAAAVRRELFGDTTGPATAPVTEEQP